MPTKTASALSGRPLDFPLLLSVHMDAFRAAPGKYMKALWWRLLRKKVRSRGQFATLLAHSRNAYAVWQIQEARNKGQEVEPASTVPIVALVDTGADSGEGLDKTLESLSRAGMQVIVIGLADDLGKIDWDSQPWLMPVRAGDIIAPTTLIAYRAALDDAETAGARLIYTDDDLLDRKGRRHAPYFKPDWNSELFAHHDYLTGACILRPCREELEQAATCPEGEGDLATGWAERLVALLAEQARPLHLRRMLHHRRSRPRPETAMLPAVAARNLPPVSIIVPTRNRVDLLKTCLDGVAATDYPDIEVIVVDNDSDDPATLSYLDALDLARHRVIRHPGPFNFSAINNRAAEQARGRLLCLLNNDIEVSDPDWLKIMAVQAVRQDVGAVGARLLYPDGRIQHAGVVIGVGNAAGHAHRFLQPGEEGYFRRHALPQFTMAVTAACLVVEKERFAAVGGLDEKHFAVAFNDVDLCLRLNQRGWQSFYEPRATLIHHESVSRGWDRDPVGAARFAGELAALQRLWRTNEITDPFHHPALSRASEQFVVGL